MLAHLEGVQAGEEGGEVGAGDARQDQGGRVRVTQGQEAVAHQGAAAAKHHAVILIIKHLKPKIRALPQLICPIKSQISSTTSLVLELDIMKDKLQDLTFLPIGRDDTVIADDPQVREEAPGVKLLDVAEQGLGVLLQNRFCVHSLYSTRVLCCLTCSCETSPDSWLSNIMRHVPHLCKTRNS